jgi:hypothetical protein
MKIKGKKLDGPNYDVIVFPRLDGDIVLKVACVLDYTPFTDMIELPVAPKIQLRGQAWKPNIDDPTYNEAINKYSELKTHWMVLKSLEINEDLEWETVDMSDTETWGNYSKELEDSGFADLHIAKIINAVASINGLNDDMMEAAKERFLAAQLVEERQNYQKDVAVSTQSGESVSD